jgi:hypothetical protein
MLREQISTRVGADQARSLAVLVAAAHLARGTTPEERGNDR